MKKWMIRAAALLSALSLCACADDEWDEEEVTVEEETDIKEEKEEKDPAPAETVAKKDHESDLATQLSVNRSSGKMTINRLNLGNKRMGDGGDWTILVYLCGTNLESGGGGMATINTLNIQAAERLTLSLIYRYYAAKYQALHANAFSEGGRTQNEHGAYLGARWNPSDHLLLQAYTDYVHFAEPRYIALHSSNTWDNMLQVTIDHGSCSWTARYRLRYRQRDNREKTALINQWEQRGRLAFTYDGGCLKSTTQGDVAHSRYEKNSFGWMVSERITAQIGKKVRLTASVGYFHTDDNDSRIYTMEPGLLYRYSFPSFEGEGLRTTFVARLDPTPRLALIARLQSTNYFDRDFISSGLQRIDHSSMTDLQLQVRWKF